jgi:hypothetical protein
MAERLGVSCPTARRRLERLALWGYIRIERHQVNGVWEVNHYWLLSEGTLPDEFNAWVGQAHTEACPTLGHECPTLGQAHTGPCPALGQTSEELWSTLGQTHAQELPIEQTSEQIRDFTKRDAVREAKQELIKAFASGSVLSPGRH